MNFCIPIDNRIAEGTFEEFENGIYKAMHRVKMSFFEVGYWLYHANDKHNFLNNTGYNNISEYALEKFGLSKSTTYDLIKIYRTFRAEDGISMKLDFIRHSQSQLVAMSRMKYVDYSFLAKIKPNDTVSDIEKAMKIYRDRTNSGRPTSAKGYSSIKEYIEINENTEPEQIIIDSRHLEKEDAEEILTAIYATKRTYAALLQRIQDKRVWTSEVRNIFCNIESNFTKLERAIQKETKN